MVEVALSQRLGRSLQQRPAQKGEEVEDERAGTPTDMRDIDFWMNFDLSISLTDIKPRPPPVCFIYAFYFEEDYLIYFIVFICDCCFPLCHILIICPCELYCSRGPGCCYHTGYLFLLFIIACWIFHVNLFSFCQDFVFEMNETLAQMYVWCSPALKTLLRWLKRQVAVNRGESSAPWPTGQQVDLHHDDEWTSRPLLFLWWMKVFFF